MLEPDELRAAVIRGLSCGRRAGSGRVTSQAQVRRLLSLVPYLREHDGVAMTEVAAAFGITVATLREDLNVLWMCGMPGLTPGDLIDIDMDAVDGEGVIHLSNADYLTRPLRLSADEALALVLALRTLREIAGPGKRDVVDRALKKLEAAAGNVPATDQATVAVTAARDDIQARVNDGLQRGLRLDLTYDVASRAETTRRMVDPLRVFVLEGYGYLEAWCYRAEALRTFRLDRIAAVEVTDTRPRRTTTSGSRICPPGGSRPCRARRWSPWNCSRGRPGWRSTTRPRPWPGTTTAGSRSRCGSPIRPGCATCCSGWAVAPG